MANERPAHVPDLLDIIPFYGQNRYSNRNAYRKGDNLEGRNDIVIGLMAGYQALAMAATVFTPMIYIAYQILND